MKAKRSGWIGIALSAALALSGVAWAAPAMSQSARLFRGIHRDARIVQEHAWKVGRFSRNAKAKWEAYDRQWNDIKPAVEEMNIRVRRLNGIRATLTPAERQSLVQSGALVSRISEETHMLRVYLNQHPQDLTSPRFARESAQLARSAGRLEHTAAQAAMTHNS
jgi:hypothetical protein